MQRNFSVSTLARRFRVKPRAISDLFYSRQLDDEVCPVISGRRIIPADYVPTIEQVLRERGMLADEFQETSSAAL